MLKSDSRKCRETPVRASFGFLAVGPSGDSSIGRALRCQRRCCGFEPRSPHDYHNCKSCERSSDEKHSGTKSPNQGVSDARVAKSFFSYGTLAERRGSGLQIRVHRFKSGRCLSTKCRSRRLSSMSHSFLRSLLETSKTNAFCDGEGSLLE